MREKQGGGPKEIKAKRRKGRKDEQGFSGLPKKGRTFWREEMECVKTLYTWGLQLF